MTFVLEEVLIITFRISYGEDGPQGSLDAGTYLAVQRSEHNSSEGSSCQS